MKGRFNEAHGDMNALERYVAFRLEDGASFLPFFLSFP